MEVINILTSQSFRKNRVPRIAKSKAIDNIDNNTGDGVSAWTPKYE